MRWTVAFATWTLLVWGGRLRNIAADDGLDGAGLALRIALASVFVVAGAAVALLLWRTNRRPTPGVGAVVRPLALFTTVVWLVRGGGIVLDSSHAAGFKVVHTVLAVVSIGLAVLADRETGGRTRRTSAPASV